MIRTNIGGTLNTNALARLHFTTLSRDQQEQAIRRMSAQGQTAGVIAAATGLAVEQIRNILGATPHAL